MKKRYISYKKEAVATSIIIMFLLCSLPINTVAQPVDQTVPSRMIEILTPSVASSAEESPLLSPGSLLLLVLPPLIVRRGWLPPYIALRDWSEKSFPNATLMFIGSGVGFRPFVGVQYAILSQSSDPPKKVQMYSGDTLYATLVGMSIPPQEPLVTFYPFYYLKSGFHHLRFVPDGNESAAIFVDIQVGLKGVAQNILPYLR